MSKKTLTGTVLNRRIKLSLVEMSQACSSQTEWVIELVEEGILVPDGHGHEDWRFTSDSITKAHIAHRLQRDLGINLAGVALAIDLLDEVESLRARLRSQA